MEKLYKNKDWLYTKYVTENNTQKEIADLCGLNSDSTIGNYIRKFEIKKEVIRHTDVKIVDKIFDSNNYGKFKVLSFHSNYKNSNVRRYLIELLDTMSQNIASKSDILNGSVADISEKNKEVFCEVCGVSNQESQVSYWKSCSKTLCTKHHEQLKRYGKTFKRTMFDKNEIVKYEDYAEIVVYNRQEKGKESTEKGRLLIDLEDVERCTRYKWQMNTSGYGMTTLKDKKHLSIHRYIMDYKGKDEIDHKDINPSNNRKCNLRITISIINSINKKISIRNTSGIIGVLFDKSKSKWVARISYNKKKYNLGRFEDKESAIKNRLIAELKYFGKEFSPQRHLFKQYGVDIDE